jgi:hypothetical protein
MFTGGSDGVISTNTFGEESEVTTTNGIVGSVIPTSELVAYATYEPVVVVHRGEDLEDDDSQDDDDDGEGGAGGDDNQDDEESQSGDDNANDQSESPSQDEDAEEPEPTGAAVRVGGGTTGSLGAATAMIASAVLGASMVLFA